jgi:nucleotide-binding universal stress UspA family protein
MAMAKVVVGYFPSESAERAFAAGVELATALGAVLHIVAAFEDGPRGGIEITDERRQAEALVAGAAARVDRSVQAVGHAIPAAPADAILQVAQEVGADVVVVGNRNAQGARRVLGSVASAVVSHAPCNVLVAKTT